MFVHFVGYGKYIHRMRNLAHEDIYFDWVPTSHSYIPKAHNYLVMLCYILGLYVDNQIYAFFPLWWDYYDCSILCPYMSFLSIWKLDPIRCSLSKFRISSPTYELATNTSISYNIRHDFHNYYILVVLVWLHFFFFKLLWNTIWYYMVMWVFFLLKVQFL